MMSLLTFFLSLALTRSEFTGLLNYISKFCVSDCFFSMTFKSLISRSNSEIEEMPGIKISIW